MICKTFDGEELNAAASLSVRRAQLGAPWKRVSQYGTELAALAALASFFALAWMVVAPYADVPILDDWVYAFSVEQLLRTGHLQLLEFSSVYPVAQIAWGALFAWAGGFSFVALRLSTVVLSVFGCWAVFLTLRELGCGPIASLLGAFAMACDPTLFALSFSFMTDVPFVAVSSIALYFYVSAVQREHRGRLWIAGAWAVVAYLIRPIGIVLPLTIVPMLIARRERQLGARTTVAAIAAPLAVMALSHLTLRHVLGPLDWETIRRDQLRWWFTIPLGTYFVWTIGVVLQAVFPFAPLLLARVAAWRHALAIAVLTLVLFVPMQRLHGAIPSVLPDWQTWSLQDIGARAVIGGDAGASAWSRQAMPIVQILGLVAGASCLLVLGRGLFVRPVWSRGHFVVLCYAAAMLAVVHVLWLYNDRYYLVFAPGVAALAAVDLDRAARVKWVAAGLLVLWSVIAMTGTRDLLAFNEACAEAVHTLEADGVLPYDIDAGYPMNGWRLYAHPERLWAGADRRSDVPFVTSKRRTPFAIVTHPPPGYVVMRTIPLPRATWQATHELYVVRRR